MLFLYFYEIIYKIKPTPIWCGMLMLPGRIRSWLLFNQIAETASLMKFHYFIFKLNTCRTYLKIHCLHTLGSCADAIKNVRISWQDVKCLVVRFNGINITFLVARVNQFEFCKSLKTACSDHRHLFILLTMQVCGTTVKQFSLQKSSPVEEVIQNIVMVFMAFEAWKAILKPLFPFTLLLLILMPGKS